MAPQGAGGRSEQPVTRVLDVRVVTHDLGALELRADEERRRKRQTFEAYCFPSKGAVRLPTRLSAGRDN